MVSQESFVNEGRLTRSRRLSMINIGSLDEKIVLFMEGEVRMPREIGFGVVGLGMGKHHCKAIDAAPNAKLIAVCDVDEERLERMTQQYGCKGYRLYAEMLVDPEIQVVNIATPSGMHAEMGIQAADAGKHVIVEKPADIAPQRVDSLIEAGRRNKVKMAGIFQSRFEPLNIRIREAIQQGKMGDLVGVHGHLPWYRAQSYFEGPHGSWKGTWNMDGGGSLMNQGVHTVDLLQWFAGPVSEVSAFFGVFGHDIEAEDHAVAVLRYQCGAMGTLYTTTCCYPGLNQRITLFGTKGTIVKEEGQLKVWKVMEDVDGAIEREMMDLYGEKKGQNASADPMAVGFDGHTQIVMDLVEAIEKDREPTLSVTQAKHAVEIVCAVYQAGRTGQSVRLA